MNDKSTSAIENKITNNFDEVSDLYGRKSLRDEMFFDMIKNAFSNPYSGTSQYGVVCIIDGQTPAASAGVSTSGPAGNPTHPWVIKARIRPIGDQAENLFTDEICKNKNDRNKLIQNLLVGAEVAYSEAIDGDENGFIPSVGDVVPIFYDIEGPASDGKKRGLRFRLQRVKRAEGGFDAKCIEALGGPPGGQVTLSRLGNPGGTLGGTGPGNPGTGAPGAISGAGVGSRPGTLSATSLAAWPSGVIGMRENEKPAKSPDLNVWNKAIERIKWWQDKANNPTYPRIPYGVNGRKSTSVKKPHILTIVDASPGKGKKDRNLWTYDLTTGMTPKTAKILVWTWSAIGRGSFSANPRYQPTNDTKGGAKDFNNGSNHTSPGMKIFGGKRTYKANSPPPKGSKEKRALAIYGIEPWNSRESRRGAIAHETKPNRVRGISFGCVATYGSVADKNKKETVHYHAWEIWKGGSWLFVWTGHDFKVKGPANVPPEVHWLPPNSACCPGGEDKRQSWDWNSPLGGHKK